MCFKKNGVKVLWNYSYNKYLEECLFKYELIARLL